MSIAFEESEEKIKQVRRPLQFSNLLWFAWQRFMLPERLYLEMKLWKPFLPCSSTRCRTWRSGRSHTHWGWRESDTARVQPSELIRWCVLELLDAFLSKLMRAVRFSALWKIDAPWQKLCALSKIDACCQNWFAASELMRAVKIDSQCRNSFAVSKLMCLERIVLEY